MSRCLGKILIFIVDIKFNKIIGVTGGNTYAKRLKRREQVQREMLGG